MQHVFRKSMVVLGYAVSSLPLLVECSLLVVGLEGPTLLYVSPRKLHNLVAMPDSQDWRGRGRLPEIVWRSMWTRRIPVQYDSPVCDFWGGLTAEDGEMMLATGLRGAAFAFCYAPGEEGQKYGGYMRSLIALPHWVLLPATVFCPVYYGLAIRWGPLFWITWLRRRLARRPGCCRTCGYDLRGSLQSGVCPECGTGFDPERVGLDKQGQWGC